MAILKLTSLWNFTSQPGVYQKAPRRSGGFSESYLTTDAYSELTGKWLTLCRARANLLSPAWTMVGWRISEVPPANDVTTATRRIASGYAGLPGTFPNTADYPTLCWLAFNNVGAGNQLRLMLRGVPDEQIIQGESATTPQWMTAINAFYRSLLPFKQRVRDVTAPQSTISSIDNLGRVLLLQGIPGLAVGNVVRVLRSIDADGRQVGGVFRVATLATTSDFTLADWDDGVTTGGRCRLNRQVDVQYQIDKFTDGVIRTRKIGRAFFQFAGKASSRA